MRTWGVLGALLLVVPAPVRAGVQDTPLPSFSDGQAAQLVAVLPGMIKDNNVETVVICTNLAAGPLDVGLEVFDETGALRNAVAMGDGALLAVAAGATVTFGTGAVVALHTDQTVTLNTAGSGTNNLRNGSGRVVASGAPAGCVALAVDSQHTIEDPAVCATCPPPSFSTVPLIAACSPTACDDGNPCTVDGCDPTGSCTHAAAPDGTACDDGNPCTTEDTCSAGVCVGTPLVCGADTPCDQVAACDPGTGQCASTTPFSACVPGGGKSSTDCAAEWVVENPSNPKGRNSGLQVCRQGDQSCDFDVDARACTFRVRVCLNSHDLNLAGCTPGQVSSYELKSPGARSLNGRSLLDAVAALAPSARSRKRPGRILFNPPDATPDQCTALEPVRVPLGRAVVVKVAVGSPTGARDKDRLRLKCVRRLGRP
jgi:hypothetical protein